MCVRGNAHRHTRVCAQMRHVTFKRGAQGTQDIGQVANYSQEENWTLTSYHNPPGNYSGITILIFLNKNITLEKKLSNHGIGNTFISITLKIFRTII